MGTKQMYRSIVAGVVLLAAVSAIQAEVYFAEDFENLALGTAISSSTPTTHGGSWDTYGAVNATVVASPGGSDQCLYFQQVIRNTRLSAKPDEAVSDASIVKFDFYQPLNVSGYLSFLFYNDLGDSIYNNFQASASYDKFRFLNYGANGNYVTAYDYPYDTWLTAEYTIPAAVSETTEEVFLFSLKITDRSTGTVLFEKNDLESKGYARPIEFIEFRAATTTPYSYYLDNISFAPVPEPATLSLLAVGALGIVLRRRSR